VDNSVQPLLSLAEGWRLGAGTGSIAGRRGCPERAGLGGALCGWHHRARPPTCSWGKKTTAAAEALGRGRGGFSTKVHVRAEGQGKPITLLLTAGQRHEATVFEALMSNGAVKRPGRGRPKIRPQRVAGDKGYCGAPIRRFLRRRGIRFTIAKKRNMCRKGPFDKAIYRQRNRVERLFNRFKQNRRLATRYEKRATNYLAMWQIAAILMWL
jgi:transposase